jgi:hypothetical protein
MVAMHAFLTAWLVVTNLPPTRLGRIVAAYSISEAHGWSLSTIPRT